MNQVNYMRVVPNSHSFGSLENILVTYDIQPDELTKEYLITGFKNTLKREYEIHHFGDYSYINPHFNTLQEIINYLEEQPNFILDNFIKLIKNTLANNMNLKLRFKMERQEVYKRIDTERDYQDLRWTPRREGIGTPDEEKPIVEWINYMEYHLAKAKEAVYLLKDEEALAEVRKITALGVRCMELHGCPERIIPDELFDGEKTIE